MANRYLILEHYVAGAGSTPDGSGAIYYDVYDTTGAVLRARTNAGVEEVGTDDAGVTTTYRVSVPDAWSGVITWSLDDGAFVLDSESFDATAAGLSGPSAVTLRFVDFARVAVPGVRFAVAGRGAGTADSFGVAAVGLPDGTYDLTAESTSNLLFPRTTLVVAGTTDVTVVGLPASTGGRAIELRRSEMAYANHFHLRGFRIRVEAVAAVDMPREVFLFSRSPVDPNTGDQTDVFETVCSFPDLSVYPALAPDPSLGLPYFRKAVVELDWPSTRDVEAFWVLVQNQVCELREALNRAEVLVVTGSAWCGPEPTADGGASDSASDSAADSSSSESA